MAGGAPGKVAGMGGRVPQESEGRWLHAGARCCIDRGKSQRRVAGRADWQPAGTLASALRVRCIRSCLPFCCGLPGSINSGRMPSRMNHAESVESLAKETVARGHAVVGADALRQAELMKEPAEDRL